MKLTRTYLKQLIKEELEAPTGDGGLEGGSQALKVIGAYLPKITRKEDYLSLFKAVMAAASQIGVSPAPQLKAMYRDGTIVNWLKSL